MAVLTRLQRRHVLLVDDENLNATAAGSLLRDGAEMVVTIASDGPKALAAIARQPPDVVLITVQMPGMDGCEVTRRIRENGALAGMPIVGLTVHGVACDLERCLAAGMDDVVSKPLDLSVLLQVLAKHLGGPASDPAPALQPPSAVAGIAYREGLRRCMGKADLYRRIAGRFLGSRPSAAMCIAQHLDAGRHVDASRVAHTLISSAGSLGALRLSELAQQLNQSLDAQDEATARVLLYALTDEETTVTRELQGLLKQVMPF